MLHTTFNKLKEANACTEGYCKLAKSLGGVKKYGSSTLISLDKILESNKLDDTLWCLKATLEDSTKLNRELACRYAEHVLPIFEAQYPNDKRPRKAIEAARKYNAGLITRKQLAAAEDAAEDAAKDAAKDAEAAAWAAWAAWAAAGAAWAAWATAGAAWAAWATAGAAERAAEKEWQKEQLLKELNK